MLTTTTTTTACLATLALLASSTNAFVVTPLSSRTTSTTTSSLNLAPILDIPLGEISNAYTFALQNFQLPTQSVTSGVLCGVGDAIAQVSGNEEEDDENDAICLDRLSAFVVKGLGGGIIWGTWYTIADDWSGTMTQDMIQHFSLTAPGAENLIKTLSQVALEQFVACPIIYSLWDIPVPALLKGTPPKEIVVQVQGKVGGLLWENAKVWTLVNCIVYQVPLQFRVLFMSVCDVFWQSVVSDVASAELITEDDDVPARVISTSLLKKKKE